MAWPLAQLCWHSRGHGFAESDSGALQAPTAVHAWGQPWLGFAVPALLQAEVPGAGSTGAVLQPGESMWLQYPLPGQAGCQGWAWRCWEHVMPTLLQAGGERETCSSGSQHRWWHPLQPLARSLVALGAPEHLLSAGRAARGITVTMTEVPGTGAGAGRSGALRGRGRGRTPALLEMGLSGLHRVEPVPSSGRGLMAPERGCRKLLRAPRALWLPLCSSPLGAAAGHAPLAELGAAVDPCMGDLTLHRGQAG